MSQPGARKEEGGAHADRVSRARKKAYLEGLFQRHGVHPKRNLGQNFILDPNLLDFIVRTADPRREDTVLEVGTGTGQLTAKLARRAGRVVSVEVDRLLHGAAGEVLSQFGNVELLLGDALASKSRLAPELLARVRERLPESKEGRLLHVSNLAFSIATPIVLNLLESGLPFQVMVVTVQRELGEKLAASSPGDTGYGSVSILTAFHGEASIVRTVPSRVFWPMPKVESAIVQILPEKRDPGLDAQYPRFRKLVRGVFTLRRKTLKKALESLGFTPKGRGAELLRACGIDPADRPGVLTLADYLRLSEALAAQEEEQAQK